MTNSPAPKKEDTAINVPAAAGPEVNKDAKKDEANKPASSSDKK